MGTVRYTATMNGNEEIYNGSSAKSWKVIQSGSFPKEYTVQSAVITYNIRQAYAPNRHMKVSRIDSGKAVELGDVPTGSTGKHSEELSTSVSYEGIKTIQLDGVERWACQLYGGSKIEIVVTWTDTITVEEKKPKTEKKKKKTGKIKTEAAKRSARFTDTRVSIEGVDISETISKYLLNLSYTDNEEDETDDLQIKLQDRNQTWLRKWLDDVIQKAAAIKYGKTVKSTKGLKLSASIALATPDGEIKTLSCGTFELDNVKASGPPSTITIKGTSLPYGNGIRTEERDKAWEGYTLMKIGKQIAENAGLGFIYDAKKDPAYRRIEQAKQTDIAFLMDLCHRNGLSLKVTNDKIVIFDQSRYEGMKAVSTIKWMDGTYTKYDLPTQEGDDKYAACCVRYYHPGKKQKIEATVYADDYDKDAENNLTLVVTNERVESIAEAENLARQILRLHNKFEKKCTFTLLGNPSINAGMTMTVSGFGYWDGKYIVRQCKHEVGTSGYTTKVTLRTIPENDTEKTKAPDEKKKTGGGGQTPGNTEKVWKTIRATTVYKAPTGPEPVGILAKDVPITILGSTSGDRTYITGANVTGYVPTGSIGKV